MPELIHLTWDALDRAMRNAGWTHYHWERGATSQSYERPAPEPFALRAQVWIDGAPVELQSTLWLACDAADRALDDLGEDDVVAWVARDPLAEDVTIERADEVDAAVGRVVSLIGATAESLLAYAAVDAFVEELATDPETSESAPMTVSAVLAVAGREREAVERARLVPGDFAERLERWLGGERPRGFEDTFSWTDAFKDAVRKARAVTPEERAQRPRATWRDVRRTGDTLVRALRGELPPDTVMPDHERAWHDVELSADAEPVLERAYEHSPLPIVPGAYIAVRLEPATEPGPLRVVVDGIDVGWLRAPDHPAPGTVSGRLDRRGRDAPLSLAVQLPGA